MKVRRDNVFRMTAEGQCLMTIKKNRPLNKTETLVECSLKQCSDLVATIEGFPLSASLLRLLFFFFFLFYTAFN